MPATRRNVEYYLPPLGTVRGTLFQESADAMALLETMREERRLQSLSQLGAIQLAWAGARHTRWEFTVLCLELLRRAVNLPRVPMTSQVRLHGGTPVSSYRELLQTWLLLLGVGHLEWTFTAERALLNAIVREANRGKKSPYDELVESAHTAEGRDWARKVLVEERFYQLYQLLAFYRIKSIGPERFPQKTRDELLRILDAYSVDRRVEPSAIPRARELFRRVRRLAFLTLDAEFTPSVLSINLGRALNDEHTLERLLIPHHPSGAEDELAGLHRNLATRIYSGQEVLREVARRRVSLDTRVLDALQKGGLRYVVNELASGNLQRGVRYDRSLKVAVRLDLDRRFVQGPFGPVIPERALELRQQEERAAAWAQRCGAQLVLEATHDASRHQHILQMHSRKSAQSRAAAIAFCHYWVQNFAPTEGGVTSYLVQRWVLGPLAEALILGALRAAFGGGLRWEWDGHVNELRAVAIRRRLFDESVREIMEPADLATYRKAELEAIRSCAVLLRTELVVASLANLKAYEGGELRPCAELDGFAMGIDRRRAELVMQLIEAKDRRRGSSAAARLALHKKIGVLGTPDHSMVRASTVRKPKDSRAGRAWVYVRIPFMAAHAADESFNDVHAEGSLWG